MKSQSLLPITAQNASITMSSREIAELTQKEHKNVLRVIRDLIEQNLVAQIEPLKFEYRNQWFDYYELNKRDTFVVVARLSPEFTAAVVDRWQELETQLLPKLPQSLPEALRLAAEQAEKAELLALENKAQSEEITALKGYFQAGLTPPQFVKGLNGVNCQQINEFLRSKGWLYKDNSKSWRVFGHIRDKYLTEQSRRIEVDPIERIEMTTYKPILLEKGAVRIFEFYMKGELPMRTDWDGKFYHSSKVAV